MIHAHMHVCFIICSINIILVTFYIYLYVLIYNKHFNPIVSFFVGLGLGNVATIFLLLGLGVSTYISSNERLPFHQLYNLQVHNSSNNHTH